MMGWTGRTQVAFGAKDVVDPIRHLLGTAAGLGRAPDPRGRVRRVVPGLPVGEHRLTVGDVPVDAFSSVSVYNAEGYCEPNDRGVYSVNSLTGRRNDDGTITVHFGGCGDGRANCIPIMDGWNYTIRLYRPHQEIIDGTWTFPPLESSPLG